MEEGELRELGLNVPGEAASHQSDIDATAMSATAASASLPSPAATAATAGPAATAPGAGARAASPAGARAPTDGGTQSIHGTTPAELRAAIRAGRWTGRPTSGLCPGHLQANLVILPAEYAGAFRQFCSENARSCPLLFCSAPGQFEAPPLATCSDVRADLPLYRVFRGGKRHEDVADITALWRDDLVCFYVGCSFTFETALMAAGVPVRNVEQGKNVPMYTTDRQCVPVPPFSARMVVSMRPMSSTHAEVRAQ